jgi:phenylacetaldehyde dehydrogenase
MDKTITQNEAARDFLQRKPAILIGNEWVEAGGGETLPVFNPATGEQISVIGAGSAGDVDRAVAAANAAFDSGVWGAMLPQERARIMLRIADLVERHAEELAELEYLDVGQPKAQYLGTVAGTANHFRYYAGWCSRITGDTVQLSRPGVFAYTQKEPVGVVGLITPWNVPLTMVGWKLAPALAAGCCCVFKPAEETSLTALRMGELIIEAGVPAGVVNIVTGLGETAGAAIAAHDGISKVSFTGSTAVGRIIIQAAMGNLKKVSLELGGKSPTIIFPDADLKKAIPGASMQIFRNSGQVCAAGSRLFVHEDIRDAVVEGITAFAKTLPVGRGDDPEAVIGPLISEKQRHTVQGYVESGLAEGANLVAGGAPIDGPGYFYQPTVMTDTHAEMKMVREEIFGPVLAIQTFAETEDVVRRANDTEYGLSSKVWTQDLSTAIKVANALKAGGVEINGGGPPDPNLPFGGYKQSGWGREHGREGLEQYLQTKSVQITL